MAREQLTFAVYLIHALAASWGKTTGETYSIFKKSGVLANYINPCYDTLHTLSTTFRRFAASQGKPRWMSIIAVAFPARLPSGNTALGDIAREAAILIQYAYLKPNKRGGLSDSSLA